MREPGDMSGVARVTFPDQHGTYIVSYIRPIKQRFAVLGEITITVPLRITKDSLSSTYNSESYSPKFTQSIKKSYAISFLQESTRTGESVSETTQK